MMLTLSPPAGQQDSDSGSHTSHAALLLCNKSFFGDQRQKSERAQKKVPVNCRTQRLSNFSVALNRKNSIETDRKHRLGEQEVSSRLISPA